MLKIVILQFLLFSSLLSFEQSLFASEIQQPDIAIVSAEISPYVYTNEQGEIVGTAVANIHKLFKKTNLTYSLEILPWKRAIQRVDSENNTLIFPLSRIADREPNYNWITPIQTLNFKLYGAKDRAEPNQNIKAIIDQGATFVCTILTVPCIILRNMGVPEKSIVNISRVNDAQMIDLIRRGRVDYMLNNSSGMDSHLKRLGIDPAVLVSVNGFEYKTVEYLAGNSHFDKILAKKLQVAGKMITLD